MTESKPCNEKLGFATLIFDLLFLIDFSLLHLLLLFLSLYDNKVIVEVVIEVIKFLFFLSI
jgi:hypothetical protein